MLAILSALFLLLVLFLPKTLGRKAKNTGKTGQKSGKPCFLTNTEVRTCHTMPFTNHNIYDLKNKEKPGSQHVSGKVGNFSAPDKKSTLCSWQTMSSANGKSLPFKNGCCSLAPPSSLQKPWKPVRLQWSDLSPTRSLGNTQSPLTTSSAVDDDDDGTEMWFLTATVSLCPQLSLPQEQKDRRIFKRVSWLPRGHTRAQTDHASSVRVCDYTDVQWQSSTFNVQGAYQTWQTSPIKCKQQQLNIVEIDYE